VHESSPISSDNSQVEARATRRLSANSRVWTSRIVASSTFADLVDRDVLSGKYAFRKNVMAKNSPSSVGSPVPMDFEMLRWRRPRLDGRFAVPPRAFGRFLFLSRSRPGRSRAKTLPRQVHPTFAASTRDRAEITGERE
jgi:hypothetical protein